MECNVKRIGFGASVGTFLVLAAALMASGCSRFSKEQAIFVAYNTSGDRVVFLVNDGAGHEVAANGSSRWTVEVLIPHNPVNSYGGPSSVDKTTQVSVAVKNLGTGKLTEPTLCPSGAKVIAHLTYRKEPNYEYVSCTSSY